MSEIGNERRSMTLQKALVPYCYQLSGE